MSGHIALKGNISEGFTAHGPYPSFDAACIAHEWEEVWIMELEPHPRELWLNNLIQFARLLNEIQASHLLDLKVLASAMDLPWERVNELFDRAVTVWEQSKKQHCPPRPPGPNHNETVQEEADRLTDCEP